MFGKLRLFEKITINSLLVILMAVWIVPLLYLIFYSLLGDGWKNYIAVLQLELFPRFLINSTVVSVSVVVVLSFSVALAGYGFSKINFPGRDALFSICLIGLMIPPSAMLLPLFHTIKALGWINTYMSLIGPEIALMMPFALLITTNFFDEIPNELLEAAKIDGANSFQRFIHVILPLGLPIMTTVGIIVFLHSWNEFLLPLAFISKQEMLTVTMAPSFFIEEYTADYNKVFAAMVLISIPIIVLYLFGQKYLQRGLTSGAIK